MPDDMQGMGGTKGQFPIENPKQRNPDTNILYEQPKK